MTTNNLKSLKKAELIELILKDGYYIRLVKEGYYTKDQLVKNLNKDTKVALIDKIESMKQSKKELTKANIFTTKVLKNLNNTMINKEVEAITPILKEIDRQINLAKRYREDNYNGVKDVINAFKYAVVKCTNKYIILVMEALGFNKQDINLVCKYSYSISMCIKIIAV